MQKRSSFYLIVTKITVTTNGIGKIIVMKTNSSTLQSYIKK